MIKNLSGKIAIDKAAMGSFVGSLILSLFFEGELRTQFLVIAGIFWSQYTHCSILKELKELNDKQNS